MDGIDPPMNAVGRIFDGTNIGMDIGNLISNITGRIMNIANTGLNMAGRIMNGLQVGLQVLSNVFKVVFAAGLIAMIVGIITMIATGWSGFTTGFRNHITCAGKEFTAGWQNQGYIIDTLARCGWFKFLNFINGSCTRYYIVDLVLGLLYGVFIELPLLLLNAIFGINLVPLINALWNLVVIPIDAIFFAISGYHLVKWSDSVINKCYRCDGNWTFSNGQTVTIYKTFGEWAELLNCSGEQIVQGFNHIFGTILPSERWSAWANKQYLAGSDWRPGFWGSKMPKKNSAEQQPYSNAFSNEIGNQKIE
tara:strand:+ start:64 stop:984 length:921 start_codon:yes stop_codon:yes gene_type:complete